METPKALKYSATHEWSKLEDGVVTVGITDFAQDQLGDVVFVELPQTGQTLSAGDAAAVVESVKTASDIYAPVSGEVVEVNGELEDAPEKLNESPYEGGWLFKLRVSDESELESLLSVEDYEKTAEEG